MITARNFWYWFGGIWLAVGLVFLTVAIAVGTSRANRDALLADEGQLASGIVIGKSITTDDNRAAVYTVIFDFDADGGQTRRGTAALTPSAWDALTERGPIEITYVPDRPEIYRVRGEDSAAAFIPYIFGLAGAAVGAIGAFVLLNARRTARRDRRLAHDGVVTAATITGVVQSRVRINGSPLWTLRYRYRDGHGQARQGSATVSVAEARRWHEGAVGRVRYDARNPKAHLWMGGDS